MIPVSDVFSSTGSFEHQQQQSRSSTTRGTGRCSPTTTPHLVASVGGALSSFSHHQPQSPSLPPVSPGHYNHSYNNHVSNGASLWLAARRSGSGLSMAVGGAPSTAALSPVAGNPLPYGVTQHTAATSRARNASGGSRQRREGASAVLSSKLTNHRSMSPLGPNMRVHQEELNVEGPRSRIDSCHATIGGQQPAPHKPRVHHSVSRGASGGSAARPAAAATAKTLNPATPAASSGPRAFLPGAAISSAPPGISSEVPSSDSSSSGEIPRSSVKSSVATLQHPSRRTASRPRPSAPSPSVAPTKCRKERGGSGDVAPPSTVVGRLSPQGSFSLHGGVKTSSPPSTPPATPPSSPNHASPPSTCPRARRRACTSRDAPIHHFDSFSEKVILYSTPVRSGSGSFGNGGESTDATTGNSAAGGAKGPREPFTVMHPQPRVNENAAATTPLPPSSNRVLGVHRPGHSDSSVCGGKDDCATPRFADPSVVQSDSDNFRGGSGGGGGDSGHVGVSPSSLKVPYGAAGALEEQDLFTPSSPVGRASRSQSPSPKRKSVRRASEQPQRRGQLAAEAVRSEEGERGLSAKERERLEMWRKRRRGSTTAGQVSEITSSAQQQAVSFLESSSSGSPYGSGFFDRSYHHHLTLRGSTGGSPMRNRGGGVVFCEQLLGDSPSSSATGEEGGWTAINADPRIGGQQAAAMNNAASRMRARRASLNPSHETQAQSREARGGATTPLSRRLSLFASRGSPIFGSSAVSPTVSSAEKPSFLKSLRRRSQSPLRPRSHSEADSSDACYWGDSTAGGLRLLGSAGAVGSSSSGGGGGASGSGGGFGFFQQTTFAAATAAAGSSGLDGGGVQSGGGAPVVPARAIGAQSTATTFEFLKRNTQRVPTAPCVGEGKANLIGPDTQFYEVLDPTGDLGLASVPRLEGKLGICSAAPDGQPSKWKAFYVRISNCTLLWFTSKASYNQRGRPSAVGCRNFILHPVTVDNGSSPNVFGILEEGNPSFDLKFRTKGSDAGEGWHDKSAWISVMLLHSQHAARIRKTASDNLSLGSIEEETCDDQSSVNEKSFSATGTTTTRGTSNDDEDEKPENGDGGIMLEEGTPTTKRSAERNGRDPSKPAAVDGRRGTRLSSLSRMIRRIRPGQ